MKRTWSLALSAFVVGCHVLLPLQAARVEQDVGVAAVDVGGPRPSDGLRKDIAAPADSAATDSTSGDVASDALQSIDTTQPEDGTGTSDACGDCQGHSCCGTTCVNLQNDILNCGKCGRVCPADKPYCENGDCAVPTCSAGQSCSAGESCCGTTCCAAGMLCCKVPGPVAAPTGCHDPVNETCPMGCVLCACLSPDTSIATPAGPVPVALVSEGDLVYSVQHAAVIAVPVARTQRVPVSDHQVRQVVLDNGQTLEVSAGHPTADGRTFSELRPGDLLDGVRLRAVSSVPYRKGHTYDILPASDTGTYFAGGVLIGSTIPLCAQ